MLALCALCLHSNQYKLMSIFWSNIYLLVLKINLFNHDVFFLFLFFFFSSRRRHTRYIGDWSSDVCSSDLSTLNEYRKYIEKDGALERRFQTVSVDPPTVDETIEILKGLRKRYEEHHRIVIPDDTLEEAARLSERYITDRFLPDKAIDVIDEAGARARLAAQVPPPEVAELKEKLEGINTDKEAAVRDQNFERAAALRDQERELQAEIRRKQEEWERERQTRRPTINEEGVAFIVSRWTGIPVTRLQEAETARLLRMDDELHESVVGQNEAIEVISRAIRRSRAGLKDPKRPIGSFIFSGPTGVGKTELAG